VRFQNGCNKVAIELRVAQFWSEIILVISNRTRAACSFDFEITRTISHQIALHSVQLPLWTTTALRTTVAVQHLPNFMVNDCGLRTVVLRVRHRGDGYFEVAPPFFLSAMLVWSLYHTNWRPRWYHVTFWPRDSIAIFEGKIAQLCGLVKSTIFIVGFSNFGIVRFKEYIFKLCGKNFAS